MKPYIQKLLIAVAFATFSYLSSYLNADAIEKIIEFFKLGFHVTLKTGQLNEFEMIPVFTVWSILGIFAYLLYLSLSNVYYEIYNSIIVKIAYKKAQEKVEVPKIMLLKRIGIHLLVIISFLLIIMILAGTIPVSNYIRDNVEKSLLPYFPLDYAFGLSFLPILLIWYFITAGTLLLYKKIKDLFFGAKIEEEHRASA